MSHNWYLLNSPHSQISGFEDEFLQDYSDGFSEVLETNVASKVELLNYDLSVDRCLNVIIQNNVQDTRLKTLSRQMLAPIGSCKAGMYVKYKNRYWLIIGLVDDNTFYEKAILILCNYLLTWLNQDNKIVQRWANITSASQYNNGEQNNKNYFVRSDQLMILTPNDDECLLLESGKRFIIDKRCRIYENDYDKTVARDNSKPLMVYQLTRSDSVLFDYQDSGHYEFMVTQDEQRESDGYYVINNKGYWLCETPSLETGFESSCVINCNSDEIFNGLEAEEFIAKFYDDNGKEVVASPKWTIECDFTEDLNIVYTANSVLISVDNVKLINKTFEIGLSAEGYPSVAKRITIKAFL